MFSSNLILGASRVVALPVAGSRISSAPSLAGGGGRRGAILRRMLFEGRRHGNRPTPTAPKRSPSRFGANNPLAPSSKPKQPPRWDERSIVQQGPVPRIFYIRHDGTILQPQHSGKVAWAGLGALTGINLAVLVMWNSGRSDDNEEWMMANFATDITNLIEGRPWTLATASISHIDVAHFGGNMFALWLFGFHTYRVIGTASFYGLYLAGGLACSATHVVHNLLTGKTQPPLSKRERERLELFASEYGPHAIDQLPPAIARQLAKADKPSLGASGSVMAISAAAAALFPLDQIRYRNIYVPLPLAAGIFILSDLSGLVSGGSPTDHAGHLGGLLMGAVYVTTAWYSKRFGSFRILRNITGGDLPIVYRYKQMLQRRGR